MFFLHCDFSLEYVLFMMKFQHLISGRGQARTERRWDSKNIHVSLAKQAVFDIQFDTCSPMK